jgi:hypothetical protein
MMFDRRKDHRIVSRVCSCFIPVLFRLVHHFWLTCFVDDLDHKISFIARYGVDNPTRS